MRSVPKTRITQTTTFRLVAAYVLVFAASVAVLGVVTYLATSVAVQHRLDARLASEMAALQTAAQSGGLARVVERVTARAPARGRDSLSYLVLGAHGERLAGHLAKAPLRDGWSDLVDGETESDGDHLRVLVAPLGEGVRLAVAADLEPVEEIRETILDGFVSAFAAVVMLGTVGGIALSLALLKRVETIRRTAEAIIAGDLSRRVPACGSGDDFDHLSQTLNRMLDRISGLMDSLRQVSADIAHDLKTPLARLRQRLETAQIHAQSAEEYNVSIEAAIGQVDEILATFGALLRIAQIEAGSRRSGFRNLDLSGICATVVEAFTPAAEDAGKTLIDAITPDLHSQGDRELLTQMIANLVENAIRHTPAGTRIVVSLGRVGDEIVGAITDNGPGVPDDERGRLFQRFYRLAQSRSTPGNGLGLSLVKAVADLHAIRLEVRDAGPGLQVMMRFASQRQQKFRGA
jgi:signal transduction histidine kinase